MRALMFSLCILLVSSGSLSADELVLPTPAGLKTGMTLAQVQEILKAHGAEVELHGAKVERSPFNRTFSVQKLRATLKTGDVGRVKLYLIGGTLARWKIYAEKSGKRPLVMSGLGKPNGESKLSHFWWNEAKLFAVKCVLIKGEKIYKKCEARDYSKLVGVIGSEQEIRGLYKKQVASEKKK